MLQEIESRKMVTSAAFLFLTALFLKLYRMLVANPMKLRDSMRLQGVPGLPAHILLGNILDIKNILTKAKADREGSHTAHGQISHDCEANVIPFTKKWREEYGNLFTFALGPMQCFYVGDPDMVKEIATCTSLDFGKPPNQIKILSPLLGQGIINSNGESWVRQRKIIAPEFYMDKVKEMAHLANDSAHSLIQTSKNVIDANGGNAEIYIDEYMRSFTVDVISKFCFGSNYSKGEAIFRKIRNLESVLSKSSLVNDYIPGIRKLPTNNNREVWALDKEIHNLILQVVHDRKKHAIDGHKDLLQIIIEGAECDERSSKKDTDQFIVDNCKNIYLAAYETIAVTATWCAMFLAVNQDWQSCVRAEVQQICDGIDDGNSGNFASLSPPAFIIIREALKDFKIGGFDIPQSVNVLTSIPALHTDPKAWGPDSYCFNPNRFANGVVDACKYPQYYMPFGVGPRVCLGQNLAMLELKMIISLMVTNFTFSLSEKYVHSPALKMIIEPGHQVPLLVKHL